MIVSMLVFFGADFIADFIASLHRRATLRIALSCSAVMSCRFHSLLKLDVATDLITPRMPTISLLPRK